MNSQFLYLYLMKILLSVKSSLIYHRLIKGCFFTPQANALVVRSFASRGFDRTEHWHIYKLTDKLLSHPYEIALEIMSYGWHSRPSILDNICCHVMQMDIISRPYEIPLIWYGRATNFVVWRNVDIISYGWVTNPSVWDSASLKKYVVALLRHCNLGPFTFMLYHFMK